MYIWSVKELFIGDINLNELELIYLYTVNGLQYCYSTLTILFDINDNP